MNVETAIKWFKQARHDLKIAERNIEIEGFDVASFLAHQSVEKLFKSVIALRGEKIPRTHHIDELARKLSLGDEIITLLSDLSVDYTFSRYPDVSEQVPFELYSREIATEKVGIARKMFEYLKGETDELD